MKTPTKPTAHRIPRARVMWRYDDFHENVTDNRDYAKSIATPGKLIPVAVIPCRTAQQARKLAAFWNLTPDEQADRIARILAPECGRHTAEVTLSVLAAIHGGRK